MKFTILANIYNNAPIHFHLSRDCEKVKVTMISKESESDHHIESKATNLGQDGLADVKAEILGVVRPGAAVEVEHQVVLASSPGGQALQP